MHPHCSFGEPFIHTDAHLKLVCVVCIGTVSTGSADTSVANNTVMQTSSMSGTNNGSAVSTTGTNEPVSDFCICLVPVSTWKASFISFLTCDR